ncbi:MAG: DUF4368 domain-containing protein [Streptococcus sp.]|nr:DUF4368 domain-containing protein [Streptococcus sp.]
MKLNQQYEIEQQELQKFIKEFESTIVKQETGKLDVSRFIERIKKYTQLDKLTTELVNELIDKIVIHKPEGNKRNRIIHIDIYYNFIGKLEK